MAEDTRELERQASEAGTTALSLAAEIAELRSELDSMLNRKAQLGKVMSDIGAVIATKDAEFQVITGKIQQANGRFVF